MSAFVGVYLIQWY